MRKDRPNPIYILIILGNFPMIPIIIYKEKGETPMGAMLTIFTIIMIILLLGMVGDGDVNNRKNYTLAFCTVVIAIMILSLRCM